MNVRHETGTSGAAAANVAQKAVGAAPVLSRLTDLAREVDLALQSLAGELDAANNPHRRAVLELGTVGNMGCPARPWSDGAFQIWQELAKKAPDDLETLHHLAIMHHARAIELESGPDPRRSDADWEAATRAWYRLWAADEFWQRIRQSAGCASADVKGLRDRLPVLLTLIHLDIALCESTPAYRVNHHVSLVDKSPFPPEYVDRARRLVYERVSNARVNPAVWDPGNSDPQEIEKATAVVADYLRKDPLCALALEDLLGFDLRLTNTRFTDMHAAGATRKDAKDKALRALKHSADRWRPYLDQLLGLIDPRPAGGAGGGGAGASPAAAGSYKPPLREDTRHKLGLWYRIMGDVHRGLDQEPDAVKFYASAVRAADDEDERRRYRGSLCDTRAYLARENAAKGQNGARAYCDEVAREPDLSSGALFLLANAYKLLEDYDAAERICRRGLDAGGAGAMDFDRMEENAEGLRRLQEMLASIQTGRLLSDAAKKMEGGDFAGALELLNRAVSRDPEDFSPVFLRCQCHLAVGQVTKAQADLKRAKASAAGDKRALEAVGKLEKEVKKAEKSTSRYGERGLALRGQAAEAFNRGDSARARQLLEQALAGCPAGAGRQEIQKELEAVRDQETLIREYGSMAVLELRSEAIEANNGKRFNDAIHILREAISLAGPAHSGKLKEELASVLCNAIGSKLEASGGLTGILDGSDQECPQWIVEAVSLDPQNTQVQQLTQLLSGIPLKPTKRRFGPGGYGLSRF